MNFSRKVADCSGQYAYVLTRGVAQIAILAVASLSSIVFIVVSLCLFEKWFCDLGEW